MIWRAFQGWIPMPDAIESAEQNISAAQRIEQEEVWALLAQAMVGYAIRDNDLAKLSAERALRVNPNMAYATA